MKMIFAILIIAASIPVCAAQNRGDGGSNDQLCGNRGQLVQIQSYLYSATNWLDYPAHSEQGRKIVRMQRASRQLQSSISKFCKSWMALDQ